MSIYAFAFLYDMVAQLKGPRPTMQKSMLHFGLLRPEWERQQRKKA